MRLDDLQIERYSRQLVLPEVGVEGQERLLRAHVTVRGDGPAAERAVAYLAAAGVGRLTAARALHAAVDPGHDDVRIAEPAPGETADAAIVVGDGGAAAAHAGHRYWIVGGRLGGSPPCPACAEAALGPEPEAGEPFGTLRALLLGTVAATETVKALLAIGTPLRGRVLHVGPTGGDVTVDVVAPRPDCPACRPADPTGS